MLKNTSGQLVSFEAIDVTTGARKVGDAANITPYCQIDGGTLNALGTLTVTEWAIGKSGTGLYYMQPGQSETNGNNILYFGLSSTANIWCKPRFIDMFPIGFNLMLDLSGSGALAQPVQVQNTSTFTNANADALLDRVDAIETGWTLRQALRILLSALGGKASGLPLNPKYRNAIDTKDRITATTDADGNRTVVTLDGT